MPCQLVQFETLTWKIIFQCYIEKIKQLFYNKAMDTLEKIKFTSLNMPFEAAEDVSLSDGRFRCQGNLADLKKHFPVTHAHLPNGQTLPLLKTMQTSVCERNCNYCCFRSGRDTPRVTLTPDELASAVVKLTRAGVAKGLFLSSGLAGGGVRTQDKLIATAEILRQKYRYQEYIHLKIMPGAEPEQVLKAMQLADRVSINLEGPHETSLRALAPHKSYFEELLKPLQIIEEIRRSTPPDLAWKGFWPSSCTQFVVGAVGETDLDLLQTTHHLHTHFNITRAYYSNFTPVSRTPFENLPPSNPWRQHRLYQAFFLLRDYQFDFQELPFSPIGNLNLEKDPKLLWAEINLLHSPIEVNIADFAQLIKIPGIGAIGAKKIIKTRTYGKIRDINTLHKMGISRARVSKFILLDGSRPSFQPSLF